MALWKYLIAEAYPTTPLNKNLNLPKLTTGVQYVSELIQLGKVADVGILYYDENMKWVRYLAVVGVGLALFLFYEYLTQPAVSPCYISSTVNCEASTKGVLSTTLGIPTAIWGLAGYIIILFAAIKNMPRLLLGMTAFGMAFCLRITFLEIFDLRVICPICLACQLVMFLLFLIAVRLNWLKK